MLQCAKKSRRPRRPRPTSSFAHALPGAFYVTYHSTIVPNFVAPGLTFYVLLCSISQRPKKCCAFCANFRSCLISIAQFPSGFSSFRFVFRVKNGAKSAHYSPFVYPVYQIYIGGPAVMQPPNAAVILPLYNCNTDLIWPFTAFRPGGTAGGRWHGSAGRSRTSAGTAPWQRQRWSRRPCSAPHFGAVDVSQFFGFLVQKYVSFVVHSANRQPCLCRV